MTTGLLDHALRTYGKQGVADACLTLQDNHGANVLLLLYASWLDAEGRSLDDSGLSRAGAALAPWYDEVIQPLRRIRRGLKQGPAPAPSQATDALRGIVKRAELEAELLGLTHLETLPLPAPAEGGEPTGTNLGRMFRMMGIDPGHADATALSQRVAMPLTDGADPGG